jgi:hypothetical protein
VGLSLGKKVLLAFVGLALGILLFEGAARLLLPNRSLEPAVPRSVGQFDELLGWSLKPLSYGSSSRTGYKIEYRINSKGLRDDETSYEKPEGTFRIVLLGDSLTFGFGVPIEKHFSTLLEGYFRDVEVINMGVGGFGVDQELIRLQTEGFRYEPDLVLAYVGHYGNRRHMYTKRFGKKKPRFVLVDGHLVLENSPVVDSSARLKSAFRRNGHSFLVKHSKAYGIFYNMYSSFSEQSREKERSLEDESFVQDVHTLGEAIVYEMAQESSKHGATFVLVTRVEELHQSVLDKKALSLYVFDPLSNPKLRLPGDLAHLNESGNGVLAWEIAQFLRTNQLIPVQHSSDHQS